jgi:tetratricopeptide (TPR) repeat protein
VRAHEQVYADRLTEHVERLAHHSVKAELWHAAARYLRGAGTKAVQRHAVREAGKWFDQALMALSRLPASRSTLEQSVDIRIDRIGILTALGDYRAVHEQACELEHLAEQLGDELRCGYVYRFKQNVANQLGRLEEARAWGTRALDIARRFEERPLRVIVTTMLEQTHFMLGEYQRVVDLAGPNVAAPPSDDERSRYSNPTIAYRYDRVAAVYDRGFVVRSLAEMGRFQEALQVLAAARQIAERLGDPFQSAWTCYAGACLHNWMGRWGEARSECEHAIDVLREAGLVTTLANILALSSYVRARLSETAEASRSASEAESHLNAARAQGRIAGNSWSLFWLCRSYLTLGQLEDAERVVDRVLEPPTGASEAHTFYLRAGIAAHLERSQYDRSEECYWRSIELADKLSMRPLSAHCRIGLARLFDERGRSDEARGHWEVAATVCRELDMQPWL